MVSRLWLYVQGVAPVCQLAKVEPVSALKGAGQDEVLVFVRAIRQATSCVVP